MAARGPAWLSKFRQEAKIAVQLNHRNLTAVDDFGEYEGQWYLVMEFLRGRDLAEEITEHPHGLPLPRVVALGVQIAEGLAAAHERGIVHRDLKPANLMLLDGDQVKICDFGIAHIAEASATHTLDGRVAGTPAFMAPEQWRGDPVDDRTDLYALGGILYALLTGALAFRGPSVNAFMGQHLNLEPPTPSAKRPRIPEALDRLVLDLLAKEPDQRPGRTADVLARLRGIEGVPEHPARPDPPAQPVPRHDGPPEERTSTPRPRTGARTPSGTLIPRRTILIAATVVVAVMVGPFIVSNLAEGAGDGEFRVRFTLTGHKKPVSSVAFSRDGSRLATGSADDTAKLWNAKTGALITTLTGHKQPVAKVVFSPDGSTLVTAGGDTAKVWNGRTGALIATLTGPRYTFGTVAYSPDGSRLVTAGTDKARLWNARTRDPVATITDTSGLDWTVVFNSDGSAFATTAGRTSRDAKVWNARTGDLITTLAGHKDRVYALAFSPDGTRLATAGGDKTAKVWNARTGDLLATLTGHRDVVDSVAFSRDGSRLATGSWDKTAKVWNARTSALITTLTGHGKSVGEVVFSPDGSLLVTASANTARIWNARTGALITTFDGKRKWIPYIGTPHWVEELTFSPDGSALAAASADVVTILEKER